MKRILVIEDEQQLAVVLGKALEEAEYEVQLAFSGEAGTRMLPSYSPDLVILDVMLPDIDGFEVMRRIRNISPVPILMLTARGSLKDRVRGLDGGADDYVIKPFRIRELLARLRALARRSTTLQVVECGSLKVNLDTRQVTVRDQIVYLSATEHAILELLAINKGNVVSKAEILERVWQDVERETNVVEVYISYLRQKLERSGRSRILHTVRGRGYMLSEEEPC